jgi:hypothetical protein
MATFRHALSSTLRLPETFFKRGSCAFLFRHRVKYAMKIMHGYAITFSLVPSKGFDGEKVYRSSYFITGPRDERIDSTQDSVQHEKKEGVPNREQLHGERRLSSMAAYRANLNYKSSWSAS